MLRPGAEKYSRVVSDALQYIRELRLPILWVDQFCIDQDDEQELLVATSKMNSIDSKAFVTLVSLGASQDEGLPGSAGTSRRTQASIRTRSGTTYVSTMSGPSGSTMSSTWSTRGSLLLISYTLCAE